MESKYSYQRIQSKVFPVYEADIGNGYKVQIFQMSNKDWGFVIMEGEKNLYGGTEDYTSMEDCIMDFEKADGDGEYFGQITEFIPS